MAAGPALAAAVTAEIARPPIRLAFERVLCPFLLLHVNRYAWASYEPGASGGGAPREATLLVKGIESQRRTAAPLLRRTLRRFLHTALLQGDVVSALEGAARALHRLPSGDVDLAELVMTAGLWREDGADVRSRAEALLRGGAGTAAEEGGATAAAPQRALFHGGPGSSKARPPHVAVAALRQSRDPDCGFVLGQRVPYVFVEVRGWAGGGGAASPPHSHAPPPPPRTRVCRMRGGAVCRVTWRRTR